MEESRKILLERIAHLPRKILSGRKLYDLEMLINGAFAPVEGFMDQETYESVVRSMRLPSGEVWPIPIVFDVEEEELYTVGQEIVLCDRFGNPLAIFIVTDRYTPSKDEEARMVYGTSDPLHVGVQQLIYETGPVYLGGKLQTIMLPQAHDFADLRATPQELKEWFAQKGWSSVVAFQTRNPMHRAHVALVENAAKSTGANLLLHPVVGMTKEGDIDYVTRVRAYKRLVETYLPEAKLALLPLAMRMAGPREALWHALIRKNYGATHFIVGRDHAGPGKDSKGVPFYGQYDAHNLVKEHEHLIGITMVPSPELVYVKEEDAYISANETQPHHTVLNISGTQLREMLRKDNPIPSWFSYPEIIEELQRSTHTNNQAGFVLFFTGLSGAGKTTIATKVRSRLIEEYGRTVTFLDGDIVRDHLSKGLGFSKEDRNTNIERIGFVAREIARHGGIAICSAIAPYAGPREKNRQAISEVGEYIEVYVSTPVAVCKKRDVKGLYAKAEAGVLTQFTGVDDPYEVPSHPEITIDTTSGEPDQSAEGIIQYLRERGYISKK
jgi:sulfate adenylyltransferase